MISLIAAIGKNNELGKNNGLIWKIKDDMKFFKDTTMGHTVIVGYNTYKSFPHGLPGRKMIVITDLEIERNDNIISTIDVEGLKNKYIDSEEEVFVIGGAFVYSQFVECAKRLYLTEIEGTCKDADTFFPKFDKKNYNKNILKVGFDNEASYQMCLYEKK